MIKTHEKYPIPAVVGKDKIYLEVNWSKDKDIKEAQKIRLTWGDKKMVIATGDLYLILVALVRRDQQGSLITPFAKVKKKSYIDRMVRIKAKNDIRKGQEINMRLKIPIEEINYT